MKTKTVFQRYELKYLMTCRQQQAVLAAMAEHMVPDEYSHSSSVTFIWIPLTTGSSAAAWRSRSIRRSSGYAAMAGRERPGRSLWN